MRLRDLQFARDFLLNEIDLPENLCREALQTNIEVSFAGQTNTTTAKNDGVLYQCPTSITQFLFHSIYSILSNHISDIQKDKLFLSLLHMCKEYVNYNFESPQFDGPPVLMDLNKLSVPSIIIHEIIKPLVGNIRTYKVLFSKCLFTDAAQIIINENALPTEYGISRELSKYDYPFIFVNADINNDASKLSDILVKTLELNFGTKKTKNILHNILLDPKSSLMENMILCLKTLRGEPDFVLNFLKYLESNLDLSDYEHNVAAEIQLSAVQADNYLNQHIKIAYSNPTHQTASQWSQWSMLVGLIEKQLAPMRGSSWPTTENLKPIEDVRRKMIADRTKIKEKSQLNFEELLEVARDMYNHHAVEPGNLAEVALKDHRVWKT